MTHDPPSTLPTRTVELTERQFSLIRIACVEARLAHMSDAENDDLHGDATMMHAHLAQQYKRIDELLT